MKTYKVVHKTVVSVGVLFHSHSYEDSKTDTFQSGAQPKIKDNGDLVFEDITGRLERAYKAGYWLSFKEGV